MLSLVFFFFFPFLFDCSDTQYHRMLSFLSTCIYLLNTWIMHYSIMTDLYTPR